MQHGRKKRIREPPTPEEIAEQQKRLGKIIKLHKMTLQSKADAIYTPEALELTTKCLTLSPDHYTIFNYRREILSNIFETEAIEETEATLKNELMMLLKFIKQNPKSYTLWFHRQWVILKCKDATELLAKELELCDYMLRADERNFHCWNYRTWLIRAFPDLKGPPEELEFTSTMIMKEFSNFSAWHYRTKVIDQIHETIPPEDFIAEEFDLLKNAYFTCPYDQSVWNYHRWLLAKVSPIRIASIKFSAQSVQVGFTMPVCDVSQTFGKVAQESGDIEGAWSAENPFSYIWTFTPASGTMGDEETTIQFNSDNTAKDINGNTNISQILFRFIKHEDTYSVKNENLDDVTLLNSELESIDELLEIEDEHRAQPLLRKAQLLQEKFYATREAPLLKDSANAYRELAEIDSKRSTYYQEQVKILQWRTEGSENSTFRIPEEVSSNRYRADLLEFISQMELTRSRLQNFHTVSWLKRRFRSTSKDKYLHVPAELVKVQELTELFHEFDFDESGTIDLDEMLEMFHNYKLLCSRDQIRTLFTIVKTKQQNAMDKEEFWKAFMSSHGSEVHKQFLDDLRQAEQVKRVEDRIFIPYSMNQLLKHILWETKAQTHNQDIRKSNFRMVMQDVRSYKNLFSMKVRSESNHSISVEKDQRYYSPKSNNRSISRLIAHGRRQGTRITKQELLEEIRGSRPSNWLSPGKVSRSRFQLDVSKSSLGAWSPKRNSSYAAGSPQRKSSMAAYSTPKAIFNRDQTFRIQYSEKTVKHKHNLRLSRYGKDPQNAVADRRDSKSSSQYIVPRQLRVFKNKKSKPIKVHNASNL